MSEPHVIRLREPWERIALNDGGVRYRRFFNTPSGLTQTTTVTIVCELPKRPMTFWLNDWPHGTHSLDEGTWVHEVSEHLVLAQRNQLDIDVHTEFDGPELPWRDVRLEIREE